MACPRCSGPASEETLQEFGGVCPKCLLDFSQEKDAPAFPNLEIVEMLGQGGMGVVYKAVQKNLGRTVALKILSPHLLDDPEFVERFTREARALASLSHPNIVGIYDSGIHDRVPYLVMEYVDGTPLRKLLSQDKLSPHRVLEVIPEICDALQYAHAHGVVHRDIKPENILVNREGRVKIADFGLAMLASQEDTRITRTGTVMGSPRYMAPEQFEGGGRVDHRADIYSLGVVFYEMLTGEIPMGRFKPPSEKALVDRRLDPVVLRSLEREPDDRWQNADEVKRRVIDLEGGPIPAPWGQRKSRIVIALLVALALCLGGLALSMSRGEISASGPVLVMVAGVAILIVLVGPIGGRRGKQTERPTLARRESFTLAVGAGAAIFLALGILLLSVVRVPLTALPRGILPPPLRAQPEPPRGGGKGRGTPVEQHVLSQSFRLADVFPEGAELPEGLGAPRILESAEARGLLGLPAALAEEAQIRVHQFESGRLTLAGIEFKTELSRRRWQKEAAWREALSSSAYFLAGQSDSAILIRHDGSALAEAAAEMLWRVVQKKWADQALDPLGTKDP